MVWAVKVVVFRSFLLKLKSASSSRLNTSWSSGLDYEVCCLREVSTAEIKSLFFPNKDQLVCVAKTEAFFFFF